eukprot:scaffold146_cov265-Pinguiococcus_pyrenoidosus.AAC.11
MSTANRTSAARTFSGSPATSSVRPGRASSSSSSTRLRHVLGTASESDTVADVLRPGLEVSSSSCSRRPCLLNASPFSTLAMSFTLFLSW